MRTVLRPLHLALCGLSLAAAAPLVGAGCASSGSAAAVDPSVPIELNNTRWKLVMLGGGLDGRVIEFKKKGNGYLGNLVELGGKLRDVPGISLENMQIFSLRPKGLNEYEGVYKAVTPSGSIQDQEVIVFVKGNSLTWNLESAVWERQE